MDWLKESNVAAVEFKSISRGLIVTDEMVKAAKVRLLLATTLCPGKYLTIVSGDVAAVEKSLKVAEQIGGRHVFSSFVISGIGPEVLDAISGKVISKIKDAIAIIESLQMANIINAADIAIDSANVEIAELRLGKGCGVNSFFIITGSLTAVNEAAASAAGFLKEEGSLIAYRVIANPDRELLKWLQPAMCSC
ncbi:MAG: BMC domain-containing protein [Actinobacteria bacterium]|nr:BMC domain-containing protein [Actinomycetota bacterium]